MCVVCGERMPLRDFMPASGTTHRKTSCLTCRARMDHSRGLRGRAPRSSPAWVRICTDCGITKPLTAFVRIKNSKNGYYGRCRACRAELARQRYQGDRDVRASDIQRAQRNRALRQAKRAGTAGTGSTAPPQVQHTGPSCGAGDMDPPMEPPSWRWRIWECRPRNRSELVLAWHSSAQCASNTSARTAGSCARSTLTCCPAIPTPGLAIKTCFATLDASIWPDSRPSLSWHRLTV